MYTESSCGCCCLKNNCFEAFKVSICAQFSGVTASGSDENDEKNPSEKKPDKKPRSHK